MEVVNGLNVASGYIHYLYNHTIGCSKLTECLYEESRQAKSSLGRKEDEIGQSIWQTIWQPVVSIPGWEKILSTLAKEHLYNHITGSSQPTVALPSMALLYNLYDTENRVFTCQQQTLVYYKALHNVNKRMITNFILDRSKVIIYGRSSLNYLLQPISRIHSWISERIHTQLVVTKYSFASLCSRKFLLLYHFKPYH